MTTRRTRPAVPARGDEPAAARGSPSADDAVDVDAPIPFPESQCHGCGAPPRLVRSARSVFILCPLHPSKYPPQPVRNCRWFVPLRALWPALVLTALLTASPGCATPGVDVARMRAATGPVGHALQLGTDGYAEVPVALDDLLAGDFTVAARVALAHPRASWAFAVGEGRRGQFVVGSVDGTGALFVRLGLVEIATSVIFPRDTFVAVAVVADGERVRVFADGREVGVGPRKRRGPVARGPLRLGHRKDAFRHQHFRGHLDDVWVAAAALPDAVVAALARGEAPPESAPVVAGYTFEAGTPLPALFGVARVVALDGPAPVAPPVPPDHATVLRLPVAGPWRVVQAFEERTSHHGYAAFAIDLVPWSEDGREHDGDGTQVDDWHCWDQPLSAPAAGVVVAVRGDQADLPPGQREPGGNAVVIEHGPGEYSEFVHLQRGSIVVAPGATVAPGQLVARCGNSGTATTPHLHFALLSSIEPVMTRPFRFDGIVRRGADGTWAPVVGPLAPGDVIRAAGGPARD